MKTLNFGEQFDITVLISNEDANEAKNVGYFDYFSNILENEFSREYKLPKDSIIQWLGYKYLPLINIYSKPIQFVGVVREK